MAAVTAATERTRTHTHARKDTHTRALGEYGLLFPADDGERLPGAGWRRRERVRRREGERREAASAWKQGRGFAGESC